jgi:endonuclease YncB( thermonuclease family)
MVMRVSLAGIDAPVNSKTQKTPGQPHRQLAKEYLSELILNKVVEIKGYGLDKNSDVLAEIFLKGKNINIQMIRAGMAKLSGDDPPQGLDLGPYRKAQNEAIKAERGIWSQVNR